PRDDLALDLGTDSLTLVEISAMLESEFGVYIPEQEVPDVRTIGDILERLPKSREEAAERIADADKIKGEMETESLDDLFDMDRSLLKRVGIRIFQMFGKLLVLIAFRSWLNQADKIPSDRAVLICPNHQSLIDPILIYALLPGDMINKMLFTGFGEYFSKPPLSWIVKPMRIILTGTGRTSADSMRLASEGLKRGFSVCIFPEGERTSTGKAMTPRIGAGLLSVDNDTPIVPIYIEGASKTLSPINPGLSFPTVSVEVMDLIDPASGEKDTRDLYQDTVDKWLSVMKNREA
ncbi:MAG: 1-acyl-sn-glycerol-3-phosphate acyltransferase, partial [Thermodesulfobacteriota bacterium]